MAIVETETHGAVFVIRMNRPERLNALGNELRAALADAWNEFDERSELEVAIYTGSGRAFCAGEDMKESLQRGAPGLDSIIRRDPFTSGTLDKPIGRDPGDRKRMTVTASGRAATTEWKTA